VAIGGFPSIHRCCSFAQVGLPLCSLGFALSDGWKAVKILGIQLWQRTSLCHSMVASHQLVGAFPPPMWVTSLHCSVSPPQISEWFPIQWWGTPMLLHGVHPCILMGSTPMPEWGFCGSFPCPDKDNAPCAGGLSPTNPMDPHSPVCLCPVCWWVFS